MSNNALYKLQAGQSIPLASDLNQIVDLLNALFDAGLISLASPVGVPTGYSGVAATGAALGIGNYMYKLTYVTGYVKSDKTIVYGGETNGGASVTVTTTSGNQSITLTLPTNWPTNVVAIRIYRTAVGGADGTQKLVATITTPIATYLDTTADGALGAGAPTTNSTGTYLQPTTAVAGVIPPSGAICVFNGQLNISNGSTLLPVGSSPLTSPLTYAL